MNKDAKARASERDSTRDDDRGRDKDMFERSVHNVFTHKITRKRKWWGRSSQNTYTNICMCITVCMFLMYSFADARSPESNLMQVH